MICQKLTLPQVPYWFPADWDNRPKPVTAPGQLKPTGGYTRLKAGENAQCGYITQPDGTPITAARAQEIRGYQYQFHRDFALEFGPEKLPTSWVKGATTEHKESYYSYMKARSLECQVCYRTWFAERIAIDNYPQWRLQYLAGLDIDDYPDMDDDPPELARDDIDDDVPDNTSTANRRAKRPANSRKNHVTARERKALRKAIIHAKKQMGKRKAARRGRAKGKGKATANSESELEYADPEPEARIDEAPFVIDERADEPANAPANTTLPRSPLSVDLPTPVAATPLTAEVTPAPASQFAPPAREALATPAPDIPPPGDIDTSISAPREPATPTNIPEVMRVPDANDLASDSHLGPINAESVAADIAPGPAPPADVQEHIHTALTSARTHSETAGRANNHIRNPFTAMVTLPAPVRAPVPAAAIGLPIPLNQDTKKKRTRKPKAAPWPPVAPANAPQKDVCAVLWYKIYEGTRDAFESFYTELRTDAARKRWYKKALADQIENGADTVTAANTLSATAFLDVSICLCPSRESGPFVNHTVNFGPFDDSIAFQNILPPNWQAHTPHCLTRDLNNYVASRYGNQDVVDRLMNASDIVEFQGNLTSFPTDVDNFGPHGGYHVALGKSMEDFYASPGDPAFYLHHAQVDRTYALWQDIQPGCRRTALNGTLSFGYTDDTPEATLDTVLNWGVLGKPRKMAELMDPMGGYMCYRYE
ncbi:hypothetical protein C8Q76DRAFT_794904 [Earliella scabrosa]|nr:hypothetical protein C8Q76DRAFT_794904 [Earliella scabrosa]